MIYTNKKEERRMLATTSPIFKLLNEKIEEITRSPEEQRLFDARMKMRSDILGEMELNYEEGIEKGIEKGSHAKAIETARNCLVLNMPISTITQITGLSEEEVTSLVK